MDVPLQWPSVHPDSLAPDTAAGVGVGDPEAIGRFWCNPPQQPTEGGRIFEQLPPGYAYGAPLAELPPTGVPVYADVPGSYYQGEFLEETPVVVEPLPPVRPKKKGERS